MAAEGELEYDREGYLKWPVVFVTTDFWISLDDGSSGDLVAVSVERSSVQTCISTRLSYQAFYHNVTFRCQGKIFIRKTLPVL